MVYGGHALPRLHGTHFSTILIISKGMKGIIFGAGLAAGSLSVLTLNHLLVSTPDFLPGFTSIAFSKFEYGHKAMEV